MQTIASPELPRLRWPRQPAAPRWLVAAVLVTVVADLATRPPTPTATAATRGSPPIRSTPALSPSRMAAIVQLAAERSPPAPAGCPPRVPGLASQPRDLIGRARAIGGWLEGVAATEPGTALRGGLALIRDGLAWPACDGTTLGHAVGFALIERGVAVVDAALAVPGLSTDERARARALLGPVPSPALDQGAVVAAEVDYGAEVVSALVAGLQVSGFPDGRAARWSHVAESADFVLRLRAASSSACAPGAELGCVAAMAGWDHEYARSLQACADQRRELVATLDRLRGAL